jgi:N-methylhydantoinase B
MFQEGLLLPPLKIWNAGHELPDIERLILANSRQPELVRGDMRAQIAITRMGVSRMKELCARFGSETLKDAFVAILNGAASQLRKEIEKLPEGSSYAEGFFDSDGFDIETPVKLAVNISIQNGKAMFDFSGSGPQTKGPINLRPPMVEACVFYSLLGSLGPTLQFNDGMLDVLEFKYAPRTVTNSQAPASVSNYQMTNLKLA